MMRRALVGEEREAYQREYLPLLNSATAGAESHNTSPGYELSHDPELHAKLRALDARFWPEEGTMPDDYEIELRTDRLVHRCKLKDIGGAGGVVNGAVGVLGEMGAPDDCAFVRWSIGAGTRMQSGINVCPYCGTPLPRLVKITPVSTDIFAEAPHA